MLHICMYVKAIFQHSKIKKSQLELLLKATKILDEKSTKWKEEIMKIKEEIQRLNNLAPPDLPEIPHKSKKGRYKKLKKV